jgi:Na+/melibiose symporter-like transporter
MFFFYTQVLNFTPQFLGQLKFMYAIGTLTGVFLYNTFLRDVSFKRIFLSTTLMYYLCYQSLIVLVTRKNVEWGINDKVFCIGDSVMLQLVAELNLMPILVLACRMCPKNIEGTMYAMLMSTINMGIYVKLCQDLSWEPNGEHFSSSRSASTRTTTPNSGFSSC